MSFNPQEVFSSLQAFLSSGYVFLAIVALLGVSLVKKLLGLIITAGVLFLIWVLCQDQILSALSQLLGFVQGWA